MFVEFLSHVLALDIAWIAALIIDKPFGFIGEVVLTPFGLFMLFLVALQEVIFIRL